MHLRLAHAGGGDHYHHGSDLLQTLLEDLVDQTVAWKHFSLVDPCVHAFASESGGEWNDEASLVFASMADKYFRRQRGS